MILLDHLLPNEVTSLNAALKIPEYWSAIPATAQRQNAAGPDVCNLPGIQNHVAKHSLGHEP